MKLTLNKLVFTFAFIYICANFAENGLKMWPWECVHCTDGYTDTQMQASFIICHMLYAITMQKIII